MAEIANALAHPLRVALVRFLDERDQGAGLDNETCNRDLVEMFDYSHSTMSQHVKVLRDSGLFETRAKGKFTMYYLNRDLLKTFGDYIQKQAGS